MDQTKLDGVPRLKWPVSMRKVTDPTIYRPDSALPDPLNPISISIQVSPDAVSFNTVLSVSLWQRALSLFQASV